VVRAGDVAPARLTGTRRDMRIGIISDTHGLLRPQALAALRGSDHLVHAGDIGDPSILAALRELAPLTAVRGNNDRDAWAAAIPEFADFTLGGVRIHVLHDVSTLALDPGTKRPRVVIAGHSHRPSTVMRDGVLFINPGSAGPRRFSLPISVATLDVDGAALRPALVTIDA
jgi:putative phosphoesterase